MNLNNLSTVNYNLKNKCSLYIKYEVSRNISDHMHSGLYNVLLSAFREGPQGRNKINYYTWELDSEVLNLGRQVRVGGLLISFHHYVGNILMANMLLIWLH